MHRALPASLISLTLFGCASVSSPSLSDTSTVTRSATVASSQPTRHPHHHHRRATSRPPRRLPTSTADNHTVQPQPPANSCRARGSGELSLPDSHCTPGAISPAVTQANLNSTICRSGYSFSVRPPESVTEREKLASMASYGDAGSAHNYEYDHLVSLELGGATNDARNLWPEPGPVPNVKDRIEDRLHALVCAGTVTLASAQSQIAHNWPAAYRRYIGPTPTS